MEGEQIQLARICYNSSTKICELQLVSCLLCDDESNPVSINLFEGNT